MTVELFPHIWLALVAGVPPRACCLPLLPRSVAYASGLTGKATAANTTAPPR